MVYLGKVADSAITKKFEELLWPKASRVRKLLGELVDMGKIIQKGNNRDKPYKRKQMHRSREN